MKKTFAIALGLVLAIFPVIASATTKAAPKQQTVEGMVAIPAYYPDGTCYPGLARRAALASNGAVNGVSGYWFDVDPATWGKRFSLKATGGQGYLDLDVYFYFDFGDIDPTTSPPTMSFANRDTNGEAGIVPQTAEKAIVCMFADVSQSQPLGAAASFKYTAVAKAKRS